MHLDKRLQGMINGCFSALDFYECTSHRDDKNTPIIIAKTFGAIQVYIFDADGGWIMEMWLSFWANDM